MFKDEVLKLPKSEIREKVSQLVHFAALEEIDELMNRIRTFKKRALISDEDIKNYDYYDYERLIDEVVDDDGQELFDSLYTLAMEMSSESDDFNINTIIDNLTDKIIDKKSMDELGLISLTWRFHIFLAMCISP